MRCFNTMTIVMLLSIAASQAKRHVVSQNDQAAVGDAMLQVQTLQRSPAEQVDSVSGSENQAQPAVEAEESPKPEAMSQSAKPRESDLQLSTEQDHKWVDHAKMKQTTMDQKTLPADVKHIHKKTMTADWHQEYPTAVHTGADGTAMHMPPAWKN